MKGMLVLSDLISVSYHFIVYLFKLINNYSVWSTVFYHCREVIVHFSGFYSATIITFGLLQLGDSYQIGNNGFGGEILFLCDSML